MMDFDEWMAKNYSGAFDMPHPREAYEAGQQSKQERIDEALAEISRAMKCCESIETECVLTEIKELLK